MGQKVSNTSIAISIRPNINKKKNRINFSTINFYVTEVSADVHTGRKKFSLSSERLSETVSLSERSATVSLAEDTAYARAIAGNFMSYKVVSRIYAKLSKIKIFKRHH